MHMHGLMLTRKSVGSHSDVLKELRGKIGGAHVIGSLAGCNTTAHYPCDKQQSRGIRSTRCESSFIHECLTAVTAIVPPLHALPKGGYQEQ